MMTDSSMRLPLIDPSLRAEARDECVVAIPMNREEDDEDRCYRPRTRHRWSSSFPLARFVLLTLAFAANSLLVQLAAFLGISLQFSDAAVARWSIDVLSRASAGAFRLSSSSSGGAAAAADVDDAASRSEPAVALVWIAVVLAELYLVRRAAMKRMVTAEKLNRRGRSSVDDGRGDGPSRDGAAPVGREEEAGMHSPAAANERRTIASRSSDDDVENDNDDGGNEATGADAERLDGAFAFGSTLGCAAYLAAVRGGWLAGAASGGEQAPPLPPVAWWQYGAGAAVLVAAASLAIVPWLRRGAAARNEWMRRHDAKAGMSEERGAWMIADKLEFGQGATKIGRNGLRDCQIILL